jgi:hypothetical protein
VIGQTGTSRVEENQPERPRQPLVELPPIRRRPPVDQVRDPVRDEDEIAVGIAHDLVGDRDALVAGVLDVRLHGVGFPSGLNPRSTGNSGDMIGAALGLVILGAVLLFLFPWVGIVVGAAGVLLVVLFLVGFGRRTQTGRP